MLFPGENALRSGSPTFLFCVFTFSLIHPLEVVPKKAFTTRAVSALGFATTNSHACGMG